MLHAAVTIVAINYLPLARTLCQSFLEHHPGARCFVLLVDRPGEEFDPSQEPFETIPLSEIKLPFGGLFPYQYSILELSTAVKPFVMQYLLEKHHFPNLLYLDPDLLITRHLSSVDEALARHSIVLTPHMVLPPPEDGKSPSETDIMLSGAYNLGFLGVANDANTTALLDWWQDRLASKCIVDLPNALFVDQRWMDMAPSYFERVCILKDKTLNVAYWNLHERQLGFADGRYTVDGDPLSFFHFSGFNPGYPERLSKHQTRHRPSDNGALAGLMLGYADRLNDNGYMSLSETPVYFSELSNGVRLNKLTQWVVREALDEKIDIPDPESNADAFCKFLMTPNYEFDKRGIAPMLVSLERIRPDVKAAFAPAFEAAEYAHMIRSWFDGSGAAEEDIEALVERYGALLDRADTCQRAVNCWRGRVDLQRAFPDAFATVAGAEAFAGWIERHGTLESGFDVGEGKRFLDRRHGLIRPLMLFLQDANLQREFKFPFLEKDRTRYVQWLYREAVPRRIVHHEDVAWFDGFASCVPDEMAAVVLGHGSWLHSNLVGGGTVFDTRQITDMLAEYGEKPSPQLLYELYLSGKGMALIAQAEQYYQYSSNLVERFPSAFVGGQGSIGLVDALLSSLSANVRSPDGVKSFRHAPSALETKGGLQGLFRGVRNAVTTLSRSSAPASEPKTAPKPELPDLQRRITAELKSGFADVERTRGGVNLAGYMMSPTGMGESVRSMARTLDAVAVPMRKMPLFSTQYRMGPGDMTTEVGSFFASHDPAHKVNLLVANGDEYRHLRARLPYAFFKDRINIGYWVWETERLPQSHADTEGLSEIWTPSHYSARAIEAVVDIPVRVVPHVIDFEEIDRAQANRQRFGLPGEGLICAYFFDCKSVLERKNPKAVLSAFRAAFGPEGNGKPRPTLLMKVSSPEASASEFAELRKAAEGLQVVWVTEELSRRDSLSLMKSIDVYVSLHRSEGFGLTMAEAMAMGKPVVASGYSGNLDFMTADNSCLVTTPVVVTDIAHGPYEARTRWGNPMIEEAARKLAALKDSDLRATIGMRAKQSIREQLAAERVGLEVRSLIAKMR